MLPKQQLPIFTLVVPSTGKKVKFRQFTVREEKMLIQAQSSDDLGVISNAVKEIITACVDGIKDVEQLALFDVEYIMTKLRAKSVGEAIDLNMPCEIDENHRRIPIRIDLEKVEVTIPKGHNKKVPLYNDVGVVMKYPTLSMLEEFETVDGVESIIMCIDYIYTQEEVFQSAEQTKEELTEFIQGLTKAQFDLIEETFFKTMPKFEYEFVYKCGECGHDHKKVIKGLSNFFS